MSCALRGLARIFDGLADGLAGVSDGLAGVPDGLAGALNGGAGALAGALRGRAGARAELSHSLPGAFDEALEQLRASVDRRPDAIQDPRGSPPTRVPARAPPALACPGPPALLRGSFFLALLPARGLLGPRLALRARG